MSVLLTGCGCKNISSVSKSLNTYNIIATFDEESKTLVCSQTVEYKNNEDVVLKSIPFHLYPNAFSEDSKHKPVSLTNEVKAYPNGKSYGGIEISALRVNGKVSPIEICGEDNNILNVKVGTLYPDDKVKIEMEYNVKLANCIHRLGYGDNTYNFGNFYPIACVYDDGGFMQKPYSYNGDPFFSEMANYEITLTIPQEFALASSGKQLFKTPSGDNHIYKAQARAVRDFAFVLSKNFEIKKQKVDDCEVIYYYIKDTKSGDSIKTCVKALETFEDLFGDYPYDTLSVVENDFVHGGMEYPNLVYISNSINDYTEYTNVIIHEIAHQWWYGLVGNNEYDEAWLDEGLTEMSCLLFYEQNPEYNISISGKKKILMSNYAMFLDVFKSVYGKVDESMNRPLDKYVNETEYVYIAYVKGNILFCDLRDFVGKKKFAKALKKYFKDNSYTNANGDCLIEAFVSVCGKKTEKFIRSYINGSVIVATK